MSSSKEYSKAIKGKLSFKGDSQKSKSNKRNREQGPTPEVADSSADISTSRETNANVDYVLEEKVGTGRLTSSGTTIHGHYTDFMNQLSPGDAIIITHPTTLQEETKIVRMVLSNVSIGISSSFSTDLISTTTFSGNLSSFTYYFETNRYLKAPKDTVDEAAQEQKEVSKKHRIEEDAFGTYASQGGEKFVYRVKKSGPGGYGGYKVITENTNKIMSRENLLDMRAKKKSDRFCY